MKNNIDRMNAENFDIHDFTHKQLENKIKENDKMMNEMGIQPLTGIGIAHHGYIVARDMRNPSPAVSRSLLFPFSLQAFPSWRKPRIKTERKSKFRIALW